jgi:hypothetical protein
MSGHGIFVTAASSGSGGSWAHIGPVFLDKGQTLSLRAGGAYSTPPKWNRRCGRPDRILLGTVDENDKFVAIDRQAA